MWHSAYSSLAVCPRFGNPLTEKGPANKKSETKIRSRVSSSNARKHKRHCAAIQGTNRDAMALVLWAKTACCFSLFAASY
jgi:hypothetical protein